MVPLQGELAPLVPALTSLDLTGSLLSSWQAVQQLAGELPGLQTLDLSCSRLAMPQAPRELLPLQMAALQTLVLSSCCVTWAQVRLVLLMLGVGVPRAAAGVCGHQSASFWPCGWLRSSVTQAQVSVELRACREVVVHCSRWRCGHQCLCGMLVLRRMGTCGHSFVPWLCCRCW